MGVGGGGCGGGGEAWQNEQEAGSPWTPEQLPSTCQAGATPALERRAWRTSDVKQLRQQARVFCFGGTGPISSDRSWEQRHSRIFETKPLVPSPTAPELPTPSDPSPCSILLELSCTVMSTPAGLGYFAFAVLPNFKASTPISLARSFWGSSRAHAQSDAFNTETAGLQSSNKTRKPGE